MNRLIPIFVFLAFAVSGRALAQAGGGIFPPSLAGPPGDAFISINTAGTQDLAERPEESYDQALQSFTITPTGRSGVFLSGLNQETILTNQDITLEDGTRVGNNLRNQQVTLGYTFAGGGGSSWSVMAGFGSTSDQLFKKSDDNTVRASIISVRPGSRSQWILGAFYFNNFNVGDFPVPVIAYLYQPSKTFRLMLGVPFINLSWGSFVGTNLFFLATPGNARIQLNQSIFGPFAVFVGAEWTTENYQHANRAEEDYQFFIERQNVFAGIRAPLVRGVMLNIMYGYRSNTRFFQAEGLFDEAEEKFELPDASFVAARLSLRF